MAPRLKPPPRGDGVFVELAVAAPAFVVLAFVGLAFVELADVVAVAIERLEVEVEEVLVLEACSGPPVMLK